MFIEITILIALVALLLYKSTSIPKGLPPGTFGLPIVGCLPPPNTPVRQYLADQKKKYGNIFTTKWGSRVIVVLADVSSIKKAMNHVDFQGRTEFYSLQLVSYFRNLGVISANGKILNDNRRFILRHLHDLGMGKTRLEISIQKEAEMMVDFLESTSMDKPSEIGWIINVAALNVIWLMMADRRYEADDPEIVKCLEMTQEMIQIIQGPMFLLDFFPWLLKVTPNVIMNSVMKCDIIESYRNQITELFTETIKEHEESLDRDHPRDVIDLYLLEIEKNKCDPETNFTNDKVNLLAIMRDMFSAGSETTSSTLRWMILCMAIRPDIQSKVHQAIDEVVPKDRLPSLDDRQKLPYVDAMVLDVMRLSSLLSTAVPHEATETVQFEGYTIPKGTLLLPCLELCQKDPALWEKPDELYPEHFLDDQGNLDSKKEAFMPFNLGRRKCPGESLARMELYLFTSAILHRFTIEAPPGVKLLARSDPNNWVLNSPLPFEVVLKKRK